MIKKENYTLYLGSMLDVLDNMPENSIDAVVTDPPYEINFMSKGWDNTGIVFQKDTWVKVLKVLKPGGHLLAFNHSRTFHRMAVAIEDAGFQIRDTILWMYGSGFPKSHNISIGIDKKFGAMGHRGVGTSFAAKTINGKTLENGKEVEQHKGITVEAKQWDGWGTALKPSYEPIIMARKPLDGTIADNVLKHGVGGINIDECRVEYENTKNPATNPKYRYNNDYKVPKGGELSQGAVAFTSGKNGINNDGRFPANTIHDGSDEVVQGFPDTNPSKSAMRGLQHTGRHGGIAELGANLKKGTNTVRGIDDEGGSAARFFYTAKASKKDRDEGLDRFDYKKAGGMKGRNDGSLDGSIVMGRNIHPTVKPTDLMQYLVRLVTPKGGKVLDPFMGSGSTGKAAMIENNERNADYHFIGIDLEQEYIDIAEARIEYGVNYRENKAIEQEREKLGDSQLRLEL